MTNARTVLIGDVHGHFGAWHALLQSAGLVDQQGDWRGGDATLVLLGDFFDRGSDGLRAVDAAMKLEGQAASQGGRVWTVLGNHDVLTLAARHFGTVPTTGPGGNFAEDWRLNGGEAGDLAGLTEAHVVWLSTRPAMVRLGDDLVTHADATFYARYGGSVDEVNAAFGALLRGRDAEAWDRLLDEFAERDTFLGEDGTQRLEDFLGQFGGTRLIHGHTPIARVTRQEPAGVTAAFEYADGRAVNVDHGLYLGGPGFVFER